MSGSIVGTRKYHAMASILNGVHIVEFRELGPRPLAGRMRADVSAEVTVVAQPQRDVVQEQLGGTVDHAYAARFTSNPGTCP